MKNKAFLLIFILLVAAYACQKDTPPDPIDPPPDPPIHVPIFEPGDTSKGAAYAHKLTASWSASVYCKTAFLDSTKIGLTLYTFKSDGSLRESIGLGAVSKYGIGLYGFATNIFHIQPDEVFTSYGTWTSDGDVSEDYYRMDSTDIKNGLVITKIDLANKRVEGTFHASYNLEEPRINSLNPKKVTFSEGRFWATIRD